MAWVGEYGKSTVDMPYNAKMGLEQDGVRERFASLGSGVWTTVFESWHHDESNGAIYCAFGPPEKRAEAVAEPEWNLPIRSYGPGFTQYYQDGQVTTVYESGIGRGGFEPLVIQREFHGIVPTTLEVVEQFRLYHNLFWDELTSQFIQPHDDGTTSVAIKIAENRVVVRTKLLRQYQAARQMDLLFFIDSVVIDAPDTQLPETQKWSDELLSASLHADVTHLSKGRRSFSRFLATRVLPPPPIERSGIWPFEEEDDHFPEFIIGTDEDGVDITYTCNPDALGDYFGGNPDVPPYLTPVHFRRDVLQKYYERPELYTVSDGRLSCASAWGLQIDNSAPETVVVFLGDLGRDLPRQERDYWRSFNVLPGSPASETFIRRSLLGQWAETTAGDLQVRAKYVSLDKSWSQHHDWKLFREPEEADAGLLKRLRLPLNDSQAEFETSIRIMAQLFVDAINEAQIQPLLPDKRENEKGISKLERWLTQEGYPHVARDIKFLRNLQEARSRVTAHRKGSDYEHVLERIFGNARGQAAIRQLFESALVMLTGLDEWLATRGSTDEGASSD